MNKSYYTRWCVIFTRWELENVKMRKYFKLEANTFSTCSEAESNRRRRIESGRINSHINILPVYSGVRNPHGLYSSIKPKEY